MSGERQPESQRESQRETIGRLYRERPRDHLVRASFVLTLLAIAAAWAVSLQDAGEVFSERRWRNLKRFAGEIVPYPARRSETPVAAAGEWAWTELSERGVEAMLQTLAISVAAIVLATLAGAALMWPAARNVASPEPLLPEARPPDRVRALLWRGVVGGTRLALVLMRAIPEYILAFLLLATLGGGAWPAVLALAIHNAGIMGKLCAEVIEDVEDSAPRALRGLGASRAHLSLVAVFPLVMPRLLMYFFYRWETCVRTATILGMLGIASLGYWVTEYRVRDRYDDMVLYIVLGAALVLVGDLVSTVARARIRRAT